MLLSHVRGLDDARLLRRGLGEKAAADVERLRNSELGSTLRDKAARDKALVRRRAERDKKLVSRGVGEVTDKALQDVEYDCFMHERHAFVASIWPGATSAG